MSKADGTMALGKVRKRRCPCGQYFVPRNTMQVAHCIEGARIVAERKMAAEVRRNIKLRKERLKTRSDWIKEAQGAFNAYIRERDKDQPCICCGELLGKESIGGGFDCGHYRSIGSAPHLRFDERNAHGQRKKCNRWGAGRAVDYRLGLIQRIGLEAVQSFESAQAHAKWTIDDLKAIKARYKAKLKELKACND